MFRPTGLNGPQARNVVRATAAGLMALAAGVTVAGAELAPRSLVTSPGTGDPLRGWFSDRTLVVGLEVDRDEARVLAYTVKPRPHVRAIQPDEPRVHDASGTVQLEVVLRGPQGLRYTRRVDAGPLCFVHDADAEPHIAGDTIVMHRDSLLLELPELAGFDRVEVAYYERDRAATLRRSLGVHELARADFDAAGGPLAHTELLFADPGDFEPQPEPQPTAAQALWPEDFADPQLYAVFGDESEGDRRINIVIVPDGYRYADKALMETHAAEMVQHFRNKTPYAQHDPFINYILVYAYSVEAGTDQCDCDIVKNTSMGTRFPEQNPACGHSDNRCLYYGSGCDTSGTSHIVAAELRAPYQDTTIVMVNTSRYGGCGGSRAVYSAANSSAKEVAVHELGHSLAGLADEYAYNSSCGSSAGEINTSKNAVSGAWPEWINNIGNPVQGAQYYQQCLYRPVFNCEMRELDQPFCPVCNQRWSLLTFGHFRVWPTAPIESQSPSPAVAAWTDIPQDFSVATRLSTGAVSNLMTWKVKPPMGLPLIVATGTAAHTHVFTQPGAYTVTAEVVADTNFVKPSKYGLNRDVATWEVEVSTLLAPSEVSAPGSPTPLRFVGPPTLIWEDAAQAGAFTYNLYRGELGDFVAGDWGGCLEQGLTGTTTDDPDSPPPGGGWFYLVAGENPAGEGPLGTTSAGTPRASSNPCE